VNVALIVVLGFIAHLVGDYLLQSDWMATEKQNSWWPSIVHGAFYTLPFLLLTLNPWAWLIIGGTHSIIDHYGFAKRIVWAKNLISPRRFWRPWKECTRNGYPPERPVHLTDWLTIITDNTLHIIINSATLVLLGTL
jgi:hypothetical protein